MINVTNGSADDYGFPFIDVVHNEGFLEEEKIILKENTNSASMNGKDYATFPTKAILYDKDNSEGSTNLTFQGFQSGGVFHFEIKFIDHFGHNVSYVKNFSAELYVVGEGSEDQASPVFGQTTTAMNNNGSILFTGARLSAKDVITYKVALRYLHQGQELKMNHTNFIEVEVRSCKIGEAAERDENDVLECRPCSNGQFSWDSSQGHCQRCDGIEGVECVGNAALPKCHYWHYSSFSTRTWKCIFREACAYENRLGQIREIVTRAHESGEMHSFEDQDDVQCAIVCFHTPQS